MMWRILIEDGVAKIPANVWDGIKKRREVHTRRREQTVDELGRVVARLKGEMRVLFAVGIYTGLRLGDCSMLEWCQVDLVRGFISLIPRKTARKNGRSVTIPIHPVLMNILLETGDGERKGYVMPECAGLYQRQPKALSERVKALCAALDALDAQERKRSSTTCKAQEGPPASLPCRAHRNLRCRPFDIH